MYRSVFESVAKWSLFVLCTLLPVFFVPLASVTVLQSKVLLVAPLLIVAGLSVLFARLPRGVIRIPKSSVVISVLVLVLVYLVSAALGGFGILSLIGTGIEQDTVVASILACSALILSALVFTAEGNGARDALRAFLLGGIALIFLQLIHLLFPELPLSAALAGATGNAFGNWHELGLISGLFAYLGLSLSDSSVGEGYWRYLCLALSGLSILFLIIVNLPDVWMSLGLLALLHLLYHWYSHRGHTRMSARQWGPWLALVLASVIFSLFGTVVTNLLPASLRVASVEVRPSWQGTLRIGQEALSKPKVLLFGAGPNTFVREWSLYKPAEVNQTQYWNSDFEAGVGSVPTSLITVGVLGLLAWAFFILSLLWTFVCSVLRPRSDAHTALLFSTGLASLYLVTFHVLYVPQVALNISTFLFTGLFLSLAVDTGRIKTLTARLSPDSTRGYMHIAAGCLAGFVLLVAGIFAFRITLAEVLVNRSILLYGSSQNIAQATRLVQQALYVYSGDERAHRAGVELGMLELQRLAAAPNATTSAARIQLQNTLQATIQHGLAAISIDSSDYQNWLQLASLYQNLAGVNVEGAYENAQAAYERALAADPANPLLYFGMAQLEVLEKKPDAALTDITSALKLKPDFAAGYYLASQIFVSKNDLTDAVTAAQLAVKYAPEDPTSWYNAGAVFYGQENWQAAVTNEKQALTLNPHYANALYVLGLSYYNLKLRADALSTFQALNVLDPGDPAVTQIIANLQSGHAPLTSPPKTLP